MGGSRRFRVRLAGLAALVALAGCTADGGGDSGGDGDGRGERAAASPSPADGDTDSPEDGTESDADADPGPGGGPDTFEEALDLAHAVLPEPGDFGAGFVPEDPYETDPTTWAVLGEDCVWQREPLPEGVLASVTRAVQVPAEDPGAGPLQGTATVTVYDSPVAADTRMAQNLEEALRCPEQQLQVDERVSELDSRWVPEQFASRADDSVYETGRFHSETYGGPHPYLWAVYREGPVTFAVAMKGAEGYDDADLSDAATSASGLMNSAVDAALGNGEE